MIPRLPLPQQDVIDGIAAYEDAVAYIQRLKATSRGAAELQLPKLPPRVTESLAGAAHQPRDHIGRLGTFHRRDARWC